MKYDIAVFIGRFQPFHLGHQAVIDEALEISDKVLVMVGSAFEPRTSYNPWFFEEREHMIRSTYNEEDNARIICEPLTDVRYSDALWVTQIQKALYKIEPSPDARITLIGQEDQGEGFYTNLFPQWGAVSIPRYEDSNGTAIRKDLLEDGTISNVDDVLIEPIMLFMKSDPGQQVKEEYDFVSLYKKGWENAPFEPTHVTVDTVVIQSGHVLLVKRKAQPGKGLFALPGGFISHDERLVNAAIRKLKEETKIKVPAPVLRGSVKNTEVFDAPYRSVRGRTITHAFHIELRSEESLPKVKAGQDSEDVFWLPLGQLKSENMFEDHYSIIQKMVGMG